MGTRVSRHACCSTLLVLQVEHVGRILNVMLLADRILLCHVLVNIARLLVLWVKHAPVITDRVLFHRPTERPHGTRITLKGTSAIKEISHSQSFYKHFGHSFEAIQVIFVYTLAKRLRCSDSFSHAFALKEWTPFSVPVHCCI